MAPRPEADNLVGIYAALQGVRKRKSLDSLGAGIFNLQDGPGRPRSRQAWPIGAEMKKLVQDPVYIDWSSRTVRSARR